MKNLAKKLREWIHFAATRVSASKNDSYLDSSEFRYILWLDRIYQKIAEVPGHMVEVGVYRGRNAIIFGHLVKMNGDDAVRKYFGFDTFDGFTQPDLTSSPHLSPDRWRDTSLDFVEARLRSHDLNTICSLVEGDCKTSVRAFLKQKPNFRAALLYIDCNAYLPAIETMELFHEYMSPGGIICIDEKLQGGETRALIDFCSRHNLVFKKDNSPFAVPAYTKLPN